MLSGLLTFLDTIYWVNSYCVLIFRFEDATFWDNFIKNEHWEEIRELGNIKAMINIERLTDDYTHVFFEEEQGNCEYLDDYEDKKIISMIIYWRQKFRNYL